VSWWQHHQTKLHMSRMLTNTVHAVSPADIQYDLNAVYVVIKTSWNDFIFIDFYPIVKVMTSRSSPTNILYAFSWNRIQYTCFWFLLKIHEVKIQLILLYGTVFLLQSSRSWKSTNPTICTVLYITYFLTNLNWWKNENSINFDCLYSAYITTLIQH
jgi:hypothetical protein